MFAVLDFETTGFSPRHHDRVIEIGVVRLDGDLEFADEWTTLVNPARDLGPTHVHGITGRMLSDAPIFDEIAGDLVERIADCIVVGHQVRFDLAFLRAELERADGWFGHHEGLCTLALVHRAGFGCGRSLAACCEYAGLTLDGAHTALGDARATASLLACLHDALGLDSLRLPVPVSVTDLPSFRASGRGVPRDTAAAQVAESFVEGLIRRLPMSSGGVEADPEAVVTYEGLLDRALEDRLVTEEEISELADLATSLGLSGDHTEQIHYSYLRGLIGLALADGVVTEAERADLEHVASLLGRREELDDLIAGAQHATAAHVAPRADEDLAGLSVCFTGQNQCTIGGEPITRSEAEVLASAAGMVVAKNVTKKVDVLVTADPDSLSGKARKARDYGTRIIAERTFWRLIDVEVE